MNHLGSIDCSSCRPLLGGVVFLARFFSRLYGSLWESRKTLKFLPGHNPSSFTAAIADGTCVFVILLTGLHVGMPISSSRE